MSPELHEILLQLLRAQQGDRCTAHALLDALNRRQRDVAMANPSSAEDVGLVPYLVNLLGTCNCQELHQAALVMLAGLSGTPEGCEDVANAGAVPDLLEVLSKGHNAASDLLISDVLSNLYADPTAHKAFRSADLVPLYMKLLQQRDETVQVLACRTLAGLCSSDCGVYSEVCDAGAFEQFVQLLVSGSDGTKLVAAQALCTLSQGADHHDALEAAGAIPALLQALTYDIDGLKLEAATALKNFASSGVDINTAVAILQLVRRLSDDDPAVVECALEGLGRISVKKHHCTLAAAGAIPALVKVLRDGTDGSKTIIARIMWDFAYYGADNGQCIVAAGAVPLLVQLLTDGITAAHEGVAGALVSLARDKDGQSAIVDAGAIPPLVQLLREGSEGTRTRAAGTLRDLVRYRDDTAQSIIAAGAVPLLVQLLIDGTDDEQERAADALTYLTFVADNRSAVVAALPFCR
jgi:hypothetical protein